MFSLSFDYTEYIVLVLYAFVLEIFSIHFTAFILFVRQLIVNKVVA